MGGGHLFFVQNFHYKKNDYYLCTANERLGSDKSQTKVGRKSDGVGTMRETMIFANIF